jgi:hypothetical protein
MESGPLKDLIGTPPLFLQCGVLDTGDLRSGIAEDGVLLDHLPPLGHASKRFVAFTDPSPVARS